MKRIRNTAYYIIQCIQTMEVGVPYLIIYEYQYLTSLFCSWNNLKTRKIIEIHTRLMVLKFDFFSLSFQQEGTWFPTQAIPQEV
jgi:riboflavin transporter FmnP